MAEIVIYTAKLCSYCRRARRLLRYKGIGFTEIDVTFNPARRAEMAERAGGGWTVPRIFIDGQVIGGSDELVKLDRSGRLDALLEA